MKKEQLKSDGETVLVEQWNSGTVKLKQWNSDGRTVRGTVEQCW